ncbi:MAG: hypothetical protein AB1938_23495 [Myxococcota bacterium]
MPVRVASASRPVAVQPTALKADTTAAEVALTRGSVQRYAGLVAEARQHLDRARAAQARPPPIEAVEQLAALEATLRSAQDMVSARLGALRALVSTAPPTHLIAAALGSRVLDVEKAGRELMEVNNRLLSLAERRAMAQHVVARAPGNAQAKRDLDVLLTKEAEATVAVRQSTLDIQRQLSALDATTLAHAETGLRSGHPVPEPQTLKAAQSQVKLLRFELDAVRTNVDRARAEQPRVLAAAVFNAKAHLERFERLLSDAQARLERLATTPLVEDVPRVVR